MLTMNEVAFVLGCGVVVFVIALVLTWPREEPKVEIKMVRPKHNHAKKGE